MARSIGDLMTLISAALISDASYAKTAQFDNTEK